MPRKNKYEDLKNLVHLTTNLMLTILSLEELNEYDKALYINGLFRIRVILKNQALQEKIGGKRNDK